LHFITHNFSMTYDSRHLVPLDSRV